MTDKLSERLEAEAARTKPAWTKAPTMNPPTKPVHDARVQALLREAAELARRVEGAAWISCSERLPEHYEHVEVYPPYEDRTYNFYAHRDGGTNGVKAGNWYHNDSEGYDWPMSPTHWRPLPEPPEVG